MQSFKPKGNNQFEIYDSTQDYPLGGQNYESSMNNINNITSTQSKNSVNHKSFLSFSSKPGVSCVDIFEFRYNK